jgi:hypothetical protein
MLSARLGPVIAVDKNNTETSKIHLEWAGVNKCRLISQSHKHSTQQSSHPPTRETFMNNIVVCKQVIATGFHSGGVSDYSLELLISHTRRDT